MSARTFAIGGLGLVAAVYGATFVVRANSGDVVEAPAGITSVAVPVGDLLTQSAPLPTIKRSRDTAPVPTPLRSDFSTPPSLPAIPLPDPNDPFGATASAAPVVEPPVDAAAVDPAPLRAELRQLLDEKLELLTVPQLQAAIIRTDSEIRELQAQDRLERLRHELENLSREYPQTWGGNAAQKLFNVPLPPASDGPTPLLPGSARQWRSDPLDSSDVPPFIPASPPSRGSRTPGA